MINVTVEEIVNAIPILNIIAQKPFKGADAFKISRLIRELNKELDSFESVRKQLINKYCEKDESGNPLIEDNNMKIQKEYIENFNNEIIELLNNRVDINADVLPIDCLDSLTITPEQAYALYSFFQ